MSSKLKIVVMGNMGAGKSTLVKRYCTGEFSMGEPTVGVSHHVLREGSNPVKKMILMPDIKIQGATAEGIQKMELTIWDTAGAERYRAVLPMYIRGSGCVVVCFDLRDTKNVNDIEVYVKLVKSIDAKVDIILACTKMDYLLTSEGSIRNTEDPKGSALRADDYDYIALDTFTPRGTLTPNYDLISDIKKYTDANDYTLIMTSALKGVNIDRLFSLAVEKAYKMHKTKFAYAADPLLPRVKKVKKTCCF